MSTKHNKNYYDGYIEKQRDGKLIATDNFGRRFQLAYAPHTECEIETDISVGAQLVGENKKISWGEHQGSIGKNILGLFTKEYCRRCTVRNDCLLYQNFVDHKNTIETKKQLDDHVHKSNLKEILIERWNTLFGFTMPSVN